MKILSLIFTGMLFCSIAYSQTRPGLVKADSINIRQNPPRATKTNLNTVRQYLINYAHKDLYIIKDSIEYPPKVLAALVDTVAFRVLHNPQRLEVKSENTLYNNITDDIVNSIPINSRYLNPTNQYHEYGIALEKKIKQLNNPYERLCAILYLGYHCYANTSTFSHFVSQADSIANNQTDIEIQGDCYINIGNFFRARNKFDIAIGYYLRAFLLFRENEDWRNCADVQYDVGIMYSMRKEHVYQTSASKYFDYSANNYKDISDYHAYHVARLLAAYAAYQYGDTILPYTLENVAYEAMQYMQHNKVNNTYEDVLFRSLGRYFGNTDDTSELKTSLQYMYAGFLVSVSEENYHIDDIYEYLYAIAIRHVKLNNKQEANKYTNLILQFLNSNVDSDVVRTQTQYLRYAEILYRLGDYNMAIVVVDRAADILLSDNSNMPVVDWLLPYGYNTAYNSSVALGDSVKQKIYGDKYNRYKRNFTDEIRGIADKEIDLEIFFYTDQLAIADNIILERELQIVFLDSQKKSLHYTIEKMNDTLYTVTTILNALSENIHSLKQDSSRLEHEKQRLENDKLKIIRDNKLIYASFVLIFMLLSLFGFLWYRKKLQQKNQQMKHDRENLTSLTQAKLHNIRNNYTIFRYLLQSEQFTTAYDYADASARLFSYSLKNWNNLDGWTISKELELLDRFYNSEKILGREVEIIPDFNGIDKEKVLFLPEVFTTLLQNSISYAFPHNANSKNIFSITGTKDDDLLKITVKDNGNPSSKEQYYSEDEHKGLMILRKRIINELKRAKVFHKVHIPFDIKTEENQGTTIQFVFPYATKL